MIARMARAAQEGDKSLEIREYLKKIGQKPISCHSDDSVQDAATKLKENGIGAMPVLSPAGMLVGMFSERDLVREFSKLGAELANRKVGDILTKSVIFMGPNAELSDAMRTMNDNGFRHIPILSEGKLLGVISIRDMLALSIPFEGSIADHPAFKKTA